MAQVWRDVRHDPRRTRVIRDPVHGYVVVPDELLPLLDHPLLQRLRHVAQTSMASTVIPSLTGSRFEHSLGTMHLARIAWSEIWEKLDDSGNDDAPGDRALFIEHVKADLLAAAETADLVSANQIDEATLEWLNGNDFVKEFNFRMGLAIGAAALLHDVGHTPFSHALEGLFERNSDSFEKAPFSFEELVEELDPHLKGMSYHELIGIKVAEQIEPRYYPQVPYYVAMRILRKGAPYTWARALSQIFAGEVDVDRMDYLQRDATRAGSEFGAIDQDRLIQSIELHKYQSPRNPLRIGWRIGYGYRARTAIETFLTNRSRYYQWILFHPHVVAANKMLDLSLQQLVDITDFPIPEDRESADAAVLKELNEIRPVLDYSSVRVTRSHHYDRGDLDMVDDDASLLRGEVDDVAILSWLKEAASLFRAMVKDKRTTEKLRDPAARFIRMYSASQFRRATWQPAWKTEDHYIAVATDVRISVVKIVTEARLALSARVASLEKAKVKSEEDNRQLTATHMQIQQLNVVIERFDSDPAQGLNTLAALLLRRSDARAAFDVERRLGEALTREAAGILNETEMQDGFWFVSFQSTVMVAEHEDATHIFRWNDTTKVSDISRMIAGLAGISASHPQFFAYYVTRAFQFEPRDQNRRNEVRRAFVTAFPAALTAVLPDLIYPIGQK